MRKGAPRQQHSAALCAACKAGKCALGAQEERDEKNGAA